MEKRKFLSLVPLPFIAWAVAAIVISGTVYAVVFVKNHVDFPRMMINEEREYPIAITNSSITERLALQTTCFNSSDSIVARIRNPLGSSVNTINLILNGTTVINDWNQTLEAGEIRLMVKGVKQGLWNCSIVPLNSTNTEMVFVDNL